MPQHLARARPRVALPEQYRRYSRHPRPGNGLGDDTHGPLPRAKSVPDRRGGARSLRGYGHRRQQRDRLRGQRSFRCGCLAMTAFEGVLFAGVRAIGLPVQVETHDDLVLIATPAEAPRSIARDQIRADAPIPGVARLLRLPGGELVETDAHDAVAALWPPKDISARVAFAIESRWWAAITGLVLTAGAVWLIVAFVLPLAAEPVSRRISPTVEAFLGKRTLEFLDRTILKPSTLTEEETEELEEKYARFVEGEDARSYRLQCRPSGRAHAAGLPGGGIRLT